MTQGEKEKVSGFGLDNRVQRKAGGRRMDKDEQ